MSYKVDITVKCDHPGCTEEMYDAEYFTAIKRKDGDYCSKFHIDVCELETDWHTQVNHDDDSEKHFCPEHKQNK